MDYVSILACALLFVSTAINTAYSIKCYECGGALGNQEQCGSTEKDVLKKFELDCDSKNIPTGTFNRCATAIQASKVAVRYCAMVSPSVDLPDNSCKVMDGSGGKSCVCSADLCNIHDKFGSLSHTDSSAHKSTAPVVRLLWRFMSSFLAISLLM